MPRSAISDAIIAAAIAKLETDGLTEQIVKELRSAAEAGTLASPKTTRSVRDLARQQ